MHPEFIFKALGYGVIGLLSIVLLVLSLILAGKEHRSEDKLKGLVFFTLAVIGLCTVIALIAANIQQAK